MSLKQYLITAKSKDKEPYAMFLGENFVWQFNSTDAALFTLSDAKDAAKNEPTHCLFVEAKKELINALQGINRVAYNGFWGFIEDFNCKTVSTRKEKKPKTKAAPEVQETSQAMRLFVVYRYLNDGTPDKKFVFTARHDKVGTIDNQQADLYTHDAAMALQKEFNNINTYQWFCAPYDTLVQTKPTPEAAPAPKKRVGYVLFGELTNGTKIYRHETKIVALLNAALDDAEPADVYMTKEQAEFIAYTVNKCAPEFVTWQVEQVEF
jgi:hypothetical protein